MIRLGSLADAPAVELASATFVRAAAQASEAEEELG
jgi:hypothetical protein